MLAAVLPCFWVYKKIGDYILSKQITNNNPYQNWINTYGGEEFATSVKIAIEISDKIAERCNEKQRLEMDEVFEYCCKLEWLFWQSAYELEKWRI